jgi:3-dehydroquinate synthase
MTQTQPSTIQVSTPTSSYPIYIGNHMFDQLGPLEQHLNGQQVAIISDTNVAPLFEPPLKQILSDYTPLSIVLEADEKHKNLATVETIYRKLLENQFHRDATLIAVGGGVVGDICGFVASTYQRGISFIQMPTTLLSQVDASVGGKTGVNHALGKNMIGTFYQPQCVIIDIAALASLPDREYKAGIAEIIKYGLIMDDAFLEDLEQHMDALLDRDVDMMHRVVHKACECKAQIVMQDEKEKGPRALLNFGHSFAHAIETAQTYKGLLHGEAVSVGMRIATQLSCELGYVDAAASKRVTDILRAAGLPLDVPKGISSEQMIALMRQDKKVADGKIRLVLLKKIGEAILEEAPSPRMMDAFLENAMAA